MLHYTDADAMRKHLRDALRQRQKWVFVTDSETGHLSLGVLALALWRRGTGDLGCGVTEVTDVGKRHSCTVSFLTVPRAALSWQEVRSFALAVSPDAAGNAPDEAEARDIFLLCKEGQENQRLLEAFLDAAFRGRLQTDGEAGNN